MPVEQPAPAADEASAASASGEAAAFRKLKVSRNVKIGAAAAGIGSAAIVAALLYANRTRKAEATPAPGEPEDIATD